MDDLCRYHDEIATIAESPCPYPEGRYSGCGMVICAGGRTYFSCAWVLVNLLRSLRCRLPIEVWHRGRLEMNDRMIRLLESVEGVRCVDASQVLERQTACRLNGWEIKPYSIINCRFEEVLFIDCDNVPIRDPSFLLRAEPYVQLGAIFWPDRWMTAGDNENFRTIADGAWEACGVPRRDEPEFEAGQMVISKRVCWKALRLTMLFNEHSAFFYHLLLGDKDTFHMAWRRLGQDYAMPMHRPLQDWQDGPVLYQHDFQGRRLFQHRNEDKWGYDGGNMRIAGFQHEDLCFRLLDELRRRWDGVVRRYPDDYTPVEREAYDRITATRLFRYGCDGLDARLMELKPDFKIGIGKDEWETEWEIEEDERGRVNLIIRNAMRKMCVLTQRDRVSWAGRKLHFDRAPLVLEPITQLPHRERRAAEEVKELFARLPDQEGEEIDQITKVRSFIYRRVGCDCRLIELLSDHTIRGGAGGRERWWYVEKTADAPELVLCGDYGPICHLRRKSDGAWTGRWLKSEKTLVELAPKPDATRQRRHIYDP